MQELSSFIELAEVHVAEAQVVEKIYVLRVLAEELLQVDAGLVELAGGEELVGAGEVVGHWISNGELLLKSLSWLRSSTPGPARWRR